MRIASGEELGEDRDERRGERLGSALLRLVGVGRDGDRGRLTLQVEVNRTETGQNPDPQATGEGEGIGRVTGDRLELADLLLALAGGLQRRLDLVFGEGAANVGRLADQKLLFA